MRRTPILAAVAACSALAVGGVAAVALTAGVAEGDTSPQDSQSAVRNAPVTASVTGDPNTLAAVAGLAADQPRRVIALSNTAAGPKVESWETESQAKASQLIAAVQARPGLAAIGIDSTIEVATKKDAAVLGGTDPNWGYAAVGAPAAAAASAGTGVTVALLDAGVDAAHPDLAGSVLTGHDMTSAAPDGTTDATGRGTMAASIIAGHGSVTGVSPGAKILPVRVIDAQGSGREAALVSGILWAANNGADIISISAATASASDVSLSAVGYATSGGIAVIAAAGDSRTADGNPAAYPAAFPGVVAVSAVNINGNALDTATAGPQIQLSAPGEQVMAATADSARAPGSGTALAAAFAAGSAAGVLASARTATPAAQGAQAIPFLISTAKDLGAAGRDDLTGAGLVQPAAAIAATAAAPVEAPAPPAPAPSDAAGDPSSAPPSAAPSDPASPVVSAPAASGPGSGVKKPNGSGINPGTVVDGGKPATQAPSVPDPAPAPAKPKSDQYVSGIPGSLDVGDSVSLDGITSEGVSVSWRSVSGNCHVSGNVLIADSSGSCTVVAVAGGSDTVRALEQSFSASITGGRGRR